MRGALDKLVANGAEYYDSITQSTLYQIHCQALTASLRDALILLKI